MLTALSVILLVSTNVAGSEPLRRLKGELIGSSISPIPCMELSNLIAETDLLLDTQPQSAAAYHILGQALRLSHVACGGARPSPHASSTAQAEAKEHALRPGTEDGPRYNWVEFPSGHPRQPRLIQARTALQRGDLLEARRQLRWFDFDRAEAELQLDDAEEHKRLWAAVQKQPKPQLREDEAATPMGALSLLEKAAILDDHALFERLVAPDNATRGLFAPNAHQLAVKCAKYAGTPLLTMCLLREWRMDPPFQVYCQTGSMSQDSCLCVTGDRVRRWLVTLARSGARWQLVSTRTALEY